MQTFEDANPLLALLPSISLPSAGKVVGNYGSSAPELESEPVGGKENK